MESRIKKRIAFMVGAVALLGLATSLLVVNRISGLWERYLVGPYMGEEEQAPFCTTRFRS